MANEQDLWRSSMEAVSDQQLIRITASYELEELTRKYQEKCKAQETIKKKIRDIAENRYGPQHQYLSNLAQLMNEEERITKDTVVLQNSIRNFKKED